MTRFLRMRHSLVTHALLLGLANAGLVLTLGLVMMGTAYNRDLLDFVRAPVGDRIMAVSRKIALDLFENDSEAWDDILKREAEGTPFEFALLDSDGKQIAGEKMMVIPRTVQQFSSSPNSALSYSPKFDTADRPDNQFNKGNFYLQRDPQTHMYWAGVHVLVHYMDENMYGHGTLVWRFSRLWTNTDIFNFWPYTILIGGALLLTILCWLPAVGFLLRRVSRLTHATRDIAEGNFDTVLPSAAQDEIGQLTSSVAMMSRQISGLIHQQQRFVSDAAHELCSPVSRLQIATELLRSNAEGEADREGSASIAREQRDYYISELAEEVQQISDLIQDLLFYSRTRSGKHPLTIEKIELAQCVRSVIEQEGMADKGVIVDVPEWLSVSVPASNFRRGMANLLRNAQQYAGEAGNVEVVAYAAADSVHLFVRDHGPGIPEEELERVFAPFYRVEYARSRHTGGTGLGLAIVQSSIEACGGSVRCRNRKPSGLEVEIILPSNVGERAPVEENVTSLHST